MNGQMFKHLANLELDASAQRVLGRPLTFEERQRWWTTPKGGVEEPWLLVVEDGDEDREAVMKAAREWDGD